MRNFSLPSAKEALEKIKLIRLGLPREVRHHRISHEEACFLRQLVADVERCQDGNAAQILLASYQDLTNWGRREERLRHRSRSFVEAFKVMAPLEGESRGHPLDPTHRVSELIQEGVQAFAPEKLRWWQAWEWKKCCRRPDLPNPNAWAGPPPRTTELETIEAIGIAGTMFHVCKRSGGDADAQALDDMCLLLSPAFSARNPYRFSVIQRFLSHLESARTTERFHVHRGMERVWHLAGANVLDCLAIPEQASNEQVAALIPSVMFSYCFMSWRGVKAVDLVSDAWSQAKKKIRQGQMATVLKRYFAQLFAMVGKDPNAYIEDWLMMTEPPLPEALRLALVMHGRQIKRAPAVRKMLANEAQWIETTETVLQHQADEAARCANDQLDFIGWFLSMDNVSRLPTMIPFLATWVQAVEQLANLNSATRLSRRDVERLIKNWGTFQPLAEDAGKPSAKLFGKAAESLDKLLAKRK